MSLNLDVNPLRVGLSRQKVVEPCVAVIFGGTGDLSYRKLMPALYHLYLDGHLPRRFAIMAYASPGISVDEYREDIKRAVAESGPNVPLDDDIWRGFSANVYYTRRSDDLMQSLRQLKDNLAEVDIKTDTGGNYLFFLSVPPFVVADYTAGLKAMGLADEPDGSWRRVVVEKPFGQDLASAHALNEALRNAFREDQIYRIDHYLGKETVQNILAFRFANSFVEPILNGEHVDHIQITVAETVGLEGRAGYYEGSGALRDMVQNHILQILSLVCMDRPRSLNAEDVRDEKVKLLRSIRRICPSDVCKMTVRAQYGSGSVLGKSVTGYIDEENVSADSQTETFVAVKLHLDNHRWLGVPVYIRTGKRLAKKVSEVAVQLRKPAGSLFEDGNGSEIEPNVISLNIQPDEGISVRFQAKTPGLDYRIRPVRMDFRYGLAFGSTPPEAYERLILDALLGDPSLFARADGTEASWEICDSILKGWSEYSVPMHTYAPGSWGPRAAMEMMEHDDRKWRRL